MMGTGYKEQRNIYNRKFHTGYNMNYLLASFSIVVVYKDIYSLHWGVVEQIPELIFHKGAIFIQMVATSIPVSTYIHAVLVPNTAEAAYLE